MNRPTKAAKWEPQSDKRKWLISSKLLYGIVPIALVGIHRLNNTHSLMKREIKKKKTFSSQIKPPIN